MEYTKFKICRYKAGKSQAELAKACGCDELLISLFETGRRKPGTLRKFIIARELGVDPKDIWG